MEPSELLTSTVDRSQVPPLHQKRIVAFINHFLINSCSFLNEFANKCETKFIELERKMQRVEVALAIIEAKLASIPENNSSENSKADNAKEPVVTTQTEIEVPTGVMVETIASTTPPPASEPIVRACEDVRYKKFFDMVRVGVPADAVKIKMRTEGFDPNILDTPNVELPDGVKS